MIQAPLLTVVIPAKDQSDHIADCLSSLIRQLPDPSDLQVIVIDDGSTDATGQIVDSFGGRLPRLEIVRNATPAGLASARNIGLRRAEGRYLAFLDADDWLAPGHLARMTQAISDLGVDFIRTDHVQVSQGLRTVRRAPEARRNRALDPRGSILPVSTSTMVDYCYAWAGIFDLRIAHLLPFPEGLHTAEDRAWCWRLHLQASSYAVVGPPGILYRRGLSTSLTQIVDRRQLDFLPSFELVFALVREDREPERWWPKAGRMFLAVLAHHLSRQQLMNAGDRATLVRRARDVVNQIPPEVLVECLQSSNEERRRLLAPTIAPPRRRTRRLVPLPEAPRTAWSGVA